MKKIFCYVLCSFVVDVFGMQTCFDERADLIQKDMTLFLEGMNLSELNKNDGALNKVCELSVVFCLEQYIPSLLGKLLLANIYKTTGIESIENWSEYRISFQLMLNSLEKNDESQLQSSINVGTTLYVRRQKSADIGNTEVLLNELREFGLIPLKKDNENITIDIDFVGNLEDLQKLLLLSPLKDGNVVAFYLKKEYLNLLDSLISSSFKVKDILLYQRSDELFTKMPRDLVDVCSKKVKNSIITHSIKELYNYIKKLESFLENGIAFFQKKFYGEDVTIENFVRRLNSVKELLYEVTLWLKKSD